MDPDINPQDREAVEIDKRRQETEKEMYKVLRVILRKDINKLSLDDKRFLKARASYLTAAERDTYAAIIDEDLSHEAQGTGDASVDAANKPEEVELTRKEIDAKARELGIDHPEKLPSKKAVLDAIDAASAN